MTAQTYFEDFQVGDHLVTPGRTITETDLVWFAGFMGDWQPRHTDAEYARHTVAGERVAQELLILAIAGGLMARAGGHAVPPSMLALWGIEDVRFIAPVRIGDTIRLESEVVQLTVLDRERGKLTVRHRGKNQRSEEVFACSTQMLVRRRAPLRGGVDG